MASVPDATVLILLGKTELVSLLPKLYGHVLLTPKVWDEAVRRGKSKGASDALYIERTAIPPEFEHVRMKAQEIRKAIELAREAYLGGGEASVLAIASERGAIALTDDGRARATARGLGVLHMGTLGIILEAHKRGLLGKREFHEAFEALGKVMWIAPDLLTRILRQAEGETQ
jgi:predicted nucleic acid-binding protein